MKRLVQNICVCVCILAITVWCLPALVAHASSQDGTIEVGGYIGDRTATSSSSQTGGGSSSTTTSSGNEGGASSTPGEGGGGDTGGGESSSSSSRITTTTSRTSTTSSGGTGQEPGPGTETTTSTGSAQSGGTWQQDTSSDTSDGPGTDGAGSNPDASAENRPVGTVNVFGNDVPLGGFGDGEGWSLVGLLLALIALVGAVVCLISGLRQGRAKSALTILAVVSGLLPLAATLVFENKTQMMIVSRFTPLIIGLFAAHVVLVVVSMALGRRQGYIADVDGDGDIDEDED